MELAQMSKSSRRQLYSERLAAYRRATSKDDKEILRVKFYDDLGKSHGFNTRMSNHLLVARPPQGVSAVDAAFEQTLSDIFSLSPVPKPIVRRGRTR